MEARPPLGIDRELCALLDPGADLRSRAALSDVHVGGAAVDHPAMAAERQRRALDPAPQQTVTEIAVEAAQFVDVHAAVVHPRALTHAALTGGTQPQKRGLIEKREPRHGRAA